MASKAEKKGKERVYARNAKVFAGIMSLAHVLGYWAPVAALELIKRKGWFARYKIQAGRQPKPELLKEALLKNAKDTFISLPLAALLFLKLLTSGKSKSEKESERAENEGGWACVRFDGPAPKAFQHFWQIAVAYLGYDAMFYWSHRLLHHPKIYKYVHFHHHRFVASVGAGASYEHLIEGVAQMFNWFLPLGFAGWLGGDLHYTTVFLYHIFRWLETVDAHCGYAFPWSPFHFIPFFGGAKMHDFHHSAFTGNYGATIIWDRLMGTENPLYNKIRLGKMENIYNA